MCRDTASTPQYWEYMRLVKISRKGEITPCQDKSTAICVGGHGGASNNSQSDCIMYIYEATNPT